MDLNKEEILGYAVDGVYAKLQDAQAEHGTDSDEYQKLANDYTELVDRYRKEFIKNTDKQAEQ